MILIALGTNKSFQGKRGAALLRAALGDVSAIACVEAASHVYASLAWPNPKDAPYANAVAQIATDLAPDELLAALNAIERCYGRRRAKRWGTRTLDIDLIDYRGEIKKPRRLNGLQLPHPRAHQRDFVLAPIEEIAPRWRHPVLGGTAGFHLARAGVRSQIRRTGFFLGAPQ